MFGLLWGYGFGLCAATEPPRVARNESDSPMLPLALIECSGLRTLATDFGSALVDVVDLDVRGQRAAHVLNLEYEIQ